MADDEVKDRTVTVRSRKEGELPAMPVADAIAKLKEEIDTNGTRGNARVLFLY